MVRFKKLKVTRLLFVFLIIDLAGCSSPNQEPKRESTLGVLPTDTPTLSPVLEIKTEVVATIDDWSGKWFVLIDSINFNNDVVDQLMYNQTIILDRDEKTPYVLELRKNQSIELTYQHDKYRLKMSEVYDYHQWYHTSDSLVLAFVYSDGVGVLRKFLYKTTVVTPARVVGELISEQVNECFGNPFE